MITILNLRHNLLRKSGVHLGRACFSVIKNEATSNEVVPKKRRRRIMLSANGVRISKEIVAQFSSPEQQAILKSFPEKYLRKKTKSDGYYFAGEKTAADIADIITKGLKPDQTLIEVNPGLGFLTKHLIERTSNNLILYESTPNFLSGLESLIKSQPDKDREILLKSMDFTTIDRMGFVDLVDNGTRVEEALKGLCYKEYDQECNARLFMMTGSVPFLTYLMNSVIFQRGITEYGRCEMFMCLPPPLLMHLTCSKTAGYSLFRATSVLFQVLFEYEFLRKVRRDEILPWLVDFKRAPGKKMTRFTSIDTDSMYLVRIVPRKNLHHYCLAGNLSTFWFFVKQHLVTRKNRIIPCLERWIPNCGPRLIVNTKPSEQPEILFPSEDKESFPPYFEPCRKLTTDDFVTDINIFTEFGDLTPMQIFSVFNQFINWPEYKECSFNASLENTLMKMNSNVENATDMEIIEEVNRTLKQKSEPQE